MTQARKLQSFIPDSPRDNKAIDEDGTLSADYQLFIDQLILGLQSNLTPEGWMLPLLTASQLATVQAVYTPYIAGTYPDMLKVLPDISGSIVFDSTNRIPKVFIITYNGATPPIILTAQWRAYVLV